MCAHNTREELHHQDLVVEGEALVVAVKEVIESLRKGLRIVKELESGEIS